MCGLSTLELLCDSAGNKKEKTMLRIYFSKTVAAASVPN